MTINTSWATPATKQTDWNADYTAGRHTYGAEYSKTTRIVLGDHVRYGGVANMSRKNTQWSGDYCS